MREGFPTQQDMSTVDKHINDPQTPEIAEQQEKLRIFEVLKKYWDREREDENQPFTRALDEVEIFGALREARPQTLEEAQELVERYHADWQKIGEITQLTRETLRGKELAGLMSYLQTSRKFTRRISNSWSEAFRSFVIKNIDKKNLSEEFGIDMYDVDYVLSQSQDARAELFSKYPELDEIRKRFHVGKLHVLRNRQKYIEQAIHRLVKEKPETVRDLITKLQNSEEPINDQDLDDLFGIKTEEAERNTNYTQLREQYPDEKFWEGGIRWTPYKLVRTMVRELNMNDSDVLYDLGSGFGRVPIYTSLATSAQCKGIEIVPQRVAESIAVKNNFGADNLEFIQGNVLEQDYSDGTVFFLFNPFAHQTLEAVNEKLRQLAQTKKIKVVSLGPSTSFFDHQDWLKPTESNEHPWGLTIYESQ